MTKMSKILWERHAPQWLHLSPCLWGLDFEPLHYKFLATPLVVLTLSDCRINHWSTLWNDYSW